MTLTLTLKVYLNIQYTNLNFTTVELHIKYAFNLIVQEYCSLQMCDKFSNMLLLLL